MTDDEIAAVMAEYAWEQVNDHDGQSSWRWTDLDPDEMAEAIDEARRWLSAARSAARLESRGPLVTAIRAQKVEATTGFEPVNRGFADLRDAVSLRVRRASSALTVARRRWSFAVSAAGSAA